MIKHFWGLILLLAGAFAAFGQGDQQKVPLFKIQDFYFLPFLQLHGSHQLSPADFALLAPSSPLLAGDYSGYYKGHSTVFASSGLEIMGALAMRNKQGDGYGNHLQLRLGGSHSSGVNLHFARSQEVRIPFDTLVSQQSNTVLYVDSLNLRFIDARNGSDYLRLQLDLIWRSKRERRWSFFAGAGLYGALLYNSVTLVHYSELKRSSLSDGQGREFFGYHPDSPISTIKEELYFNKSSIGGAICLPIGLDFRVGQRRELLRRLHLYTELRPGFDISRIPEYGHRSRGFMQLGLGLRVS